MLISVAVIAVTAYLLGGINGAIIISKLFYKKDIRDFESGSAGLTNFQRVFGPQVAVWVMVIDVVKSAAATFIGGAILGRLGNPALGKYIGGFFAMLGHTFPIYYGFKGGKGVLTMGTFVLCVDFWVGIVCLSIFFAVVAVTKYVSLGSIIGSGMVWVAALLVRHNAQEAFFMMLCWLFILIMHRGNIKRLIKGEERKFSFRR